MCTGDGEPGVSWHYRAKEIGREIALLETPRRTSRQCDIEGFKGGGGVEGGDVIFSSLVIGTWPAVPTEKYFLG